MKKPPLRAFRTENFKAIRDSGQINFDWLTVFIGNNGVGKSSLIEALETYRDISIDGIDSAFRRWKGFEHVWNKSRDRIRIKTASEGAELPYAMSFNVGWQNAQRKYRFQSKITMNEGGNRVFFKEETCSYRRPGRTENWVRDELGNTSFKGTRDKIAEPAVKTAPITPDKSLQSLFAWETFDYWQFLALNPERMGEPSPQQLSTKRLKINRDGSNIAEYLKEIRELDVNAFDGVLEALQYVLPYARDLQPTLTSEIDRSFYLKLKEAAFEVPGWLLSTGTLRIVSLLACLRHPKPPPLLVIEEIENGLDPRTLHLVVEEIRAAITAGTTQVILTTHSPYLLDLLDLSQIVVVERQDGQPTFHRPDGEELAKWSKSFSPGRLYTMGRLTKGDQQ